MTDYGQARMNAADQHELGLIASQFPGRTIEVVVPGLDCRPLDHYRENRTALSLDAPHQARDPFRGDHAGCRCDISFVDEPPRDHARFSHRDDLYRWLGGAS